MHANGDFTTPRPNGQDPYAKLLEHKLVRAEAVGFDVPLSDISPVLFDWQRIVVQWALRLGKAALFEECGLGKTLQQLEWSRHVAAHTGRPVLILTPLAVAHQTVREAAKLDLPVKYVRSQEQVAGDVQVYVTNYEMLKAFDAAAFAGVVLDESSILKAFTGQTKRQIVATFKDTPFKLACTATPSPNDHLELGNHADFLDVMPSNEMISRWFINNTMKAGDYKLKAKGESDFWRWVTTWAVCISTPSDIGYDDNGFILPGLNTQEHRVAVDHTRAFESGRLLLDAALSATNMWQEKRETAADRAAMAADIVAQNPDDFYVIWCDTNDEADLLQGLFPDAVEVRGSDSIKSKEENLTAFSEGKVKKIITKPDIAGFGLNWQHCRNQIFVGVTYSFERLYQALRRSWRFGVTGEVNAHLIYAESEASIIDTLKQKQEQHQEMQTKMNEAMKEYGLRVEQGLKLSGDVIEETAQGKDWTLYRGDSVQVIKTLPDNSVDFTIFSPPFSNLYIYSDSIFDMGNSADDEEFFAHFEFLIPELYRVTTPGRLVAIHCKDLPMYMNRDGAAGLKDFPGEIIRRFEKYGWVFHSRVTIWKDPVIEMQRTKNHGLLHKNFEVRAEVTRQGMADYLVVLRKWDGVIGSESTKPVRHKLSRPNGNGGHQYAGTDAPQAPDDRYYSIQVWQRYASPVWFDINQTNVLNFRQAREDEEEKHICPLQLDVIERAVDLWTNPGDVVLSPFAGIGSEGYPTLKRGRKFVGIELKKSYFDVAARYLQEAELASNQTDLFSFAGVDVAA